MPKNKPDKKTMSDKKLRRLEHTCSMTLERFLDIAGKTCGKMGKFDSAPVPIEERAKLVLWRQRENMAQRAYLDARTKLMDYLTGAAVS